ncbi:MAG: MFS transporter [Clostridia bacterium]|nr:MFS transporter [Clostridia bacterium]
MKLKIETRNAIYIGGTCAFAYLAVYIMRNILSAVSPQMLEQNVLTEGALGTLSSAFFIVYAVGQLINGFIGDRIKAHYMVCGGLVFAAVAGVFFAIFPESVPTATFTYGLSGFFLSMVFGPMTKIVAENVSLLYVERCSACHAFTSLFGSPAAGLIAMVLPWRASLYVTAVVLLAVGVICFVFFSLFEKRGIIAYNRYTPTEKQGGGIGILFRHQIIKFTVVSILTGVVRTAVVFWLPTYLSQYLGFSAEISALLFTVTTLLISASSFLTVIVYERLGRNRDCTLLLSFAASAICFILLYFVKQPVLNITLITLAILFANCAASVLWTIYCPGLRETGLVSGATGFLDFVSYMAASVASTLFANAVSDIGWNGLILVWFALMALGLVISLPIKRKAKA